MSQDSQFEPRTVADLSQQRYTFRVPAYQRGYRWAEEQVTKLLDDLAAWDGQSPYSLQPVIVHEPDHDHKTFDVVDGQQRLTTIALVLGKRAHYSLQYETRPETSIFLGKLQGGNDPYGQHELKDLFGKKGKLRQLEPKYHTIDNYHLLAAYRAIEDWKKESGNRKQFQEVQRKLLDAELLWYRIEENPRVVFARINSGKIQLGNADLIKATLLKDDTERSSLIARQWDEIEQQLADDSFWAFLGQDLRNKYNRIEVLFRLLVPARDSNRSQFGVHSLYNDCVQAYGNGRQQPDFLRLWEHVWTLFETLREWYSANPIYHRVGYLSRWNAGKTANLFNIVAAYEKYTSSTKADFARWLDGQIASTVRSGIKDKAGNPPENAQALTENVAYGDTSNRDIEKVLLLFNLPIAPGDWPPDGYEERSEIDRYRYPFDLHIREKWSVEHIHAQSPKKPDPEEEVRAYLDGVQKMLAEQINDNSVFTGDSESLLEAADEIAQKREHNIGIEKLRKQIDDIHTRIEEAMSQRKDSLDNLALLPGRLNTSIGNGFFFEKRRKIKEQDAAGRFIPRETRNVFLKYYSDNLSGALWSNEDRERYMHAIRDELQPWFKPHEED